MGATNLDMQEKSVVLALVREGLSNREIGRKIGRSEAAVRRVKRAASASGTSATPCRKPGSGRPKKTNKRTDKLLEREVKRDPFITAKELKGNYNSLLENVSVRTLQRRLQKDLHLPCRRAVQKPLLTEKMKKQRLDFCKKYEHWTSQDWSKVIFSDESTFKTVSKDKRNVRRPVGADRFDKKYTVKTVKFPASVMVWGCFSGEKGTGGVYFLDKNVTMNQNLYINVLNNHMLPFYEGHNSAMFLHDGAPCHRARSVKEWLALHNIEMVEWPGHSPDLNPIENVWNDMKRKMIKMPILSVDALTENIRNLWTTMDRAYLTKLSDSMPKRIKAVLKVKGEMTKY